MALARRARPATTADAPEVVRLAGVMYASMGVPAEALERDGPWWNAGIELLCRRLREGDGAAVVVDREGGGLCASGAAVVSTRFPAPGNLTARVAYVQWIATDHDARRQGLARQVMEGLIAWCEAQGVGAIELHATPEGEPLYRQLGFGDEGSLALRRRRPAP